MVCSVTSETSSQDHINNHNLNNVHEDVLYHLGLTYNEDQKGSVESFSDVKFFITGGSADRMKRFAEKLSEKLSHETTRTYTMAPVGTTSRYSIYKVGPVLIANHGMGMPSMSILLHEVSKLLHYAKAKDFIYIRIGTSGGVGVEPGTAVISSAGVNYKLESVHTINVLGEEVHRPSILDADLIKRVEECAKEIDIPTAVGKTLCCDDFYEEQGRLDGAICEYDEKKKMDFLKRCHEAGVRNIEMESRAFAAFCHKLQIPGAVICVTLLNRLDGDQVTRPKSELKGFDDRPMNVIMHLIAKQLSEASN